MINLRRLFQQGGPGSGNFDHEGRPGQVGGSEPDKTFNDKASKVKVKRVTTSRGVPLVLEEDVKYGETSLVLPNGKRAQRYTVKTADGTPIGRLTETPAYKDKKSPGSRIVTDRKSVVGYNLETFNEKYPMWERGENTINRQYAIDWLESRAPK